MMQPAGHHLAELNPSPTVHRPFHKRSAAWYDAVKSVHFVMWWVTWGHVAPVCEAMARFRHLEAEGPGDAAFGWAYLKEAQAWKTHGCTHAEE